MSTLLSSFRTIALAVAWVGVVELTVAEPPPMDTPAVRMIASANAALSSGAKHCESYNLLAGGLLRRVQETCDPSYYVSAAEAIDASIHLDPNNWETLKLRVRLQVGQGNYIGALYNAEVISSKVPDDLLIAVYLADIHLALGNYVEAEKSAQWSLDLRRGNSAGLLRGAALREAFGDVDGAIEFYTKAMSGVSESDIDEKASILTDVARLELLAGKVIAADALVKQALGIFPDYPNALRVLGKIRFVQEKFDESANCFKTLITIALRPQFKYDLAQALDRGTNPESATAAFDEFERSAKAIMDDAINANHELILFYADRAGKPAEALRLAKREMERRHDIATRDAYAWALYANGDVAEAKKQVDIALAVGSRTPSLCYHAGVIALKTGDTKAAVEYLQKAITANGPESGPARRILADRSSP